MHQTVNCRFSAVVEGRLRKGLIEAVSVLRDLRKRLSVMQKTVYVLSLHREVHNAMSPFQAKGIPALEQLPSEPCFQSLLQFSLDEPTIREVFLGGVGTSLLDDPKTGEMTKGYVEQTLLRLCAFLEDQGPARLDDLLDFLSLDVVERRVKVPVLNVDLAGDEIALSRFGRLRRLRQCTINPRPAPLVELSFSVKTAHFALAAMTPVSEEIKKRVSLIRLAAQPLAAYNRFWVECHLPWEEFVPDFQFATRFWSKSLTEHPVPLVEIGPEHAEEIELLAERLLSSPHWNTVTTWRVACDRLDDAVFKLECGSPDSILDIVIGLESLLVEPGNTQESTHKVAVRAARYLEERIETRREIVRLVKQAYGARSKLAHGQAWTLDEKGLAQLAESAKVLARILGRMGLQAETQLDHLSLDLS